MMYGRIVAVAFVVLSGAPSDDYDEFEDMNDPMDRAWWLEESGYEEPEAPVPTEETPNVDDE